MPSAQVVPMDGDPVQGSLVVVTDQALEFVLPTVTDAVTAVFELLDEVKRMAIVSPLLKPATGPALKADAFLEIPMQPALQVAVSPANVPDKVTALLSIGALVMTFVWGVKLNGFGEFRVVVTDHRFDFVAPTLTVAVAVVFGADDELIWMANVSPGEKMGPLDALPFLRIAEQPEQLAARRPVNPDKVIALLVIVDPKVTPV